MVQNRSTFISISIIKNASKPLKTIIFYSITIVKIKIFFCASQKIFDKKAIFRGDKSGFLEYPGGEILLR